MKGTGADVIKVTDTITVTGTLTNYNGTIEFETGCTLDSYVAGSGEQEEGPANVVKYTFSNYKAGTQYAANEVHKLDDIVTVTTTEAHFTTELRLYSSSTHDGYAIISSTKVIDAIILNAGYKADTLNVYGSTDGKDWTLIKGVAVTGTYTDYTVKITDSAYTYLKLDVAGTQQVRIKYMTLTFAE